MFCIKLIFMQNLEDISKIQLMLSFGVAKSIDVIEVDYNQISNKRAKDRVYQSHKGKGIFGHTKIYNYAIVGSVFSSERCLGDIFVNNAYLIVFGFQFNLLNYPGTAELIQQFAGDRRGYQF